MAEASPSQGPKGGSSLGPRRDVEEEVEPQADQEAEEFVSEDHVLVSFTSANTGNDFAEGSLVLITPPETVENASGIQGAIQGGIGEDA